MKSLMITTSPDAGQRLSLYANLLDPASVAPGSNGGLDSASPKVDGGPASATVDEAVKKQQALAASLRFQPTKRPQKQGGGGATAAAAAAAAKAKAKAIASKLTAPAGTADDTPATSGAKADGRSPPVPAVPRTTAADWAATASDDEWNYGNDKRGRGGRKNKKRKAKEAQLVAQDWDDIYDPTRPNSYEEYKHSDEKVREVREWRELLYRHRRTKTRRSSDSDSDRSSLSSRPRPVNRLFAPPPNLNSGQEKRHNNEGSADDDQDEEADSLQPSRPPADIPDDPTGEDAYARRLRMSQNQISRAPVRYDLPPAPPDTESESAVATSAVADDAAQERTNLPGQTGFAERLMAKYGWSKGQGLGAKGTGITNALYAKAEKRKKKSDAEGGGYVTPATMGKIMGGQKSKEAAAEEEGPFGAMSEVVRLGGMLDGLDIDAEMSADGGGLVQEIGDECGSKYGSVQRVYIHRAHDAGALVFVHFVSALSALRAVNALDGRMFGGNTISARFWDKDRFLAEEYE
ncbi:hypothetical protein DV738_g3673, partial [Chaetothyriales sp. CBS 135597]